MLTFGRLLTFKNLIMRKTVFLCSFLLALAASAEKLIKTTPETFLQDLESVKQAVQNQSEDISLSHWTKPTAEETDTKSSSGQLREKPRSSAEVCVSPVGNTYPARSTKHPSKAMKNYAPSSSTANVAAWPADVLWKKAWAR